MDDLEIAKLQLRKENVALAIVKDGKILFLTQTPRISGFIEAIDQLGGKLENSSVADKVVGKAIAFLCVYVKAKSVYADILSQKAKTVLNESGISCYWRELVEKILSPDRSRLCPFEEMTERLSSPIEAYNAFKKLQETLGCRD